MNVLPLVQQKMPAFVSNRETLAIEMMCRIHADHSSTALTTDKYSGKFSGKWGVSDLGTEVLGDVFYGDRSVADVAGVQYSRLSDGRGCFIKYPVSNERRVSAHLVISGSANFWASLDVLG